MLSVLNRYDEFDTGSIDMGFAYDGREPVSALTIGYDPSWFEGEEVRSTDLAALDALKRLGATVREITLPDLPVDEILGALNVESAAVFEALTLSNRDDLMRRQVNEAWPNALRQSWYFSAVDFMQGERLRRRVMEQTHEFFDQVDVVCGPSFGTPMLSLTNLTGQPCLAMRAGFEEARTRPLFEHPENEDNPALYRVPRSISLMSNLFDEGKIFTVGRALEAALGVAAERPPIA